VFYYQK